jgi:V8-like Glu-specific endopeptidase
MVVRTIKLASMTLLLLSALLVVIPDARAQKGNSVSTSSPAQQNAIAATANREWTLEEMKSARPYPAIRQGGPEEYKQPPVPDGPPGTTPSFKGGPALTIKESLMAEQNESAAAIFEPEATAAPAYSYPYPFSRWEQLSTRYTDYPYRTVGKVFFRQNGVPFVCSASSIGNYGVITAGHCVSNGKGVYHTNWVFVPAYYQAASTIAAAAPYGQFTAAKLFVRTLWHTGGGDDWQEDIGGAILNKNTIGASTLKVSQRVGTLGTAWNQSIVQHWHSIGYPQAAPFTGMRMIICAAGYAKTDITIVGSTYATFGIGCDMTGGASGGPMIRKLAAAPLAGTNQVNGVNSYKYNSTQPLALYSPYFASNAQSIIGCIINSSPTLTKCVAPAAP